MTNQNVVVSDASSGIGMAVTLAVTNSAMYQSSTHKPPPSPGSYITISSRKFPKTIETGVLAGSKINMWVDSMRASSPTHVRPSTSISDAREYSSWVLKHPSAIENFEEIAKAAEGKQIVMFMDYDGTLSPIVEDPVKAYMSKEMRGAVRDAARHFPTAIVTGRCIDKVCSFVRLGELYYAGSHGMDIKGPATKILKYKNNNNRQMGFQPAKDFLPMIEEVYKILVEKTKSTEGATVENNKFCVSVHFRCVDEKRWAALAEQVKLVLSDYPKLKLTLGRKVLEIRPTIKWDKGKALEFLLESLGYAKSDDVFPVYIGDDRTDEDAFNVLRDRDQGLGIIVSKIPKETSASYSLKEPSEVMCFLRRLTEWKRMSTHGQN